LLPDFEGEVEILGKNLRDDTQEIKQYIGYVPENAELYDVLTPMEFLDFTGKLYEMPEKLIVQRAERLLKFFGLEGNRDKRMDTFSKGMKQKVLLISGLLHEPRIIFLDEPLSGLDANAVILVKDVIARLAKDGKTILYSSHMMDVVEKVANRILLLNQGNVIADGTFEELKKSGNESLERIFAHLTGNDSDADLSEEFLNAFKD